MWMNRLKFKKNKFFYNKQVNLELFTKNEFILFDFKSILPCFQKKLPLIVITSKMECNKVITQVLDEHQSLFFILHLNIQFHL